MLSAAVLRGGEVSACWCRLVLIAVLSCFLLSLRCFSVCVLASLWSAATESSQTSRVFIFINKIIARCPRVRFIFTFSSMRELIAPFGLDFLFANHTNMLQVLLEWIFGCLGFILWSCCRTSSAPHWWNQLWVTLEPCDGKPRLS